MKEKIIKMIEEYPIGTKLERVFDDYTEEVTVFGYEIFETGMIVKVECNDGMGSINYENMGKLTRRIEEC